MLKEMVRSQKSETRTKVRVRVRANPHPNPKPKPNPNSNPNPTKDIQNAQLRRKVSAAPLERERRPVPLAGQASP